MFKFRPFFFFALAYGIFTLIAAPVSQKVFAASSPWVKGHKSEVRLIAAAPQVGTAEEILLGLEFVLDPKWKIYWRSPGEAGQPPIPDWSGSQNLKSAEIQWPIPERFSFFGIETFGYKNRVVLPVKAKLDQPGSPVDLKVPVAYLICEELCIPASVNLSLQLGSGDLVPDGEDETIRAYLETVPATGNGGALKIEDFRVDTSLGENPVLLVSASAAGGFSEPDLMVEGPEGYAFSVPEVTLSEDTKFAGLRLEATRLFDPETLISRDNVTLTLVDGDEGVEVSAASLSPVMSQQPAPVSQQTAPVSQQTAPVSQQTAPAQKPTAPLAATTLFWMVLLAVAGGLILNLMPCVLPVLSLKFMAVIGKSDKSRGEIQKSFLATTLGIIASFLVLACALIGLKSAGAAIGWGIQFQQPVFVLLLTAVILLFAANMLGWFEISMPLAFANALDKAGRLNSGRSGSGLASDFMTGAFATLLATPCSAPFLGTAVSFALVQSAPVILLIFLALGVGMALPYLTLIAFPGAIRFMPKPGNWMNGLRKVLALLLLATAIWLLSVLLAQLGPVPVYIAAFVCVIMLALLWLASKQGRGVLPVALVCALALVVLPQLTGENPEGRNVTLKAPWVAFDEAKIAAHIASGKTVYVDVTADWCVTCKVNKAVVFASDDVKSAFASENLVAMSADWTRPDAGIAGYLKRFNRAGIPFNAVYSARLPDGMALPELLTPGLVLEALAKAR